MKKAGIKDVARISGVSIGTVSKILNHETAANGFRVSEQTRARVEEVARQLHYRPNAIAQMMRGESSRIIGYAVSMPLDHNYSYLSNYTCRLLNGIGSFASEQGYQVLLLNGVDYSDFLEVRRLEGMILIGYAPAHNPQLAQMNSLYRHFIDHHYPFVVINGYDEPSPDSGEVLPVPRITQDHNHGVNQIAELIVQRQFRDVGFIGEPSSNPQYEHLLRYRLLGEALGRHGIVMDPAASIVRAGDDVPDLPHCGEYSQIDGIEAVRVLERRGRIPRVLVCGNDAIAMGVMNRLQQIGLSIPKDVAVIGFDDDPESKYLSPALTTVRQPLEDMGAAAASYLIDLIKNSQSTQSLPIFTPQLIVRESV